MSPDKKFSVFLWKPKIHYWIHNKASGPCLELDGSSPHFLHLVNGITFQYYPPPVLTSSKRSLYDFPTKMSNVFYVYSMK
jgi:hypothetical protein